MFEFAHPWSLVLLLIVPFTVWWYARWGKRREGTIQFSSVGLVKQVAHLDGRRKVRVLMAVRLAVLALVIVAIARPRSPLDLSETPVNVVDIALVLDISSSMRAEDFRPNRLEAAKLTASRFIREREGDRIGLLVFAGESYIQCPLTIDYDVLQGLLSQVTIIDEKHDGTAIGMAIAHAINRLRGSGARSRIIVLLSDGSNNAGELDPLTAAEFAEEYGIKIYAIGVGRKGKAPYPVDDPLLGKRYVQVDVDVDEETLQKLADVTGGQYFRATDEQRLEEIYEEINRLERSEIKVKGYVRYEELFPWFLLPAVLLSFAEGVLSDGIFRRRN
ncbi:MAG: VWA domain-containing protein [Fidelibacterota bacterium]